MAAIKDLPYELLYHIIFLLVQSSSGAEDFARIISVCKNFLMYAEDVSILRVVSFNIKMEPMSFYHFQYVKGLLVKCSEAGNVAARHLLGKVLLLSYAQLFFSEWQKVKFDVSPCDLRTLQRWILDNNVSAQDSKVGPFMTYFSPTQVYSSEFSATRLVHYQVVKLFLLNGSHDDFIEMGVFLKYYIKYFIGVARESIISNPLIASINLLVSRALCVRSMEKLVKAKESLNDYFGGVREILEDKEKFIDKYFEDLYSARSGNSGNMDFGGYVLLRDMYVLKCITVGVDWREANIDVNIVNALREDVIGELNVACTDFSIIRGLTLNCFEHEFG